MFLKRTEYPGVNLSEIYIGAVVTIYSRQLKIVDYADVHTRQHFQEARAR